MTAPEQLFDERELRDVLAPMVPSADEFTEGVHARIAAAGARRLEPDDETSVVGEDGLVDDADPQSDAGDDTDPRRDSDGDTVQSRLLRMPPFVRRVAAMLPPGLVSAGFANSAKAATANLGWKGAAAFLLWPAVFLLSALAVFVLGVRRARGLRAEGTEAAQSRQYRQRYEWRFRLVPWILLAVPLLVLLALRLAPRATSRVFTALSSLGAVETLLGALVATMVVVLVVLGMLSRDGLASRRIVGSFCGGLLGFLAFASIPTIYGDWHSERVDGWLLFALLVGSGAVCRIASISQFRAVTIAGAVLGGVLSLVFLDVWGLVGQRPLTDQRVQAWVESFDQPLSSLDWNDLHIAVEGLRAVGVEPNLSRAKSSVRRQVSRELTGNPKRLPVDPRSDMVRWSRSMYHAVAVGVEVDRLLAAVRPERVPNRPLLGSLDESWALRVLALIHADLDPDRGDALAERLVESVRSGDVDRAGLRELDLTVDLLDVLDRPDLVGGLRDRVHEVLRSTWSGADLDAVPTFGAEGAARGSHPLRFTASTFHAVRLLCRFGVPAGLDGFHRFDDWLRRASSSPRLLAVPRRWHYAFAGLHRLVEREVEVPVAPPVSLGQLLLEERVSLTVMLLIAMCVWMTFRAPRSPVQLDPFR